MSIFKIICHWFCYAWMPFYFGGDSTSTTKQTTNNIDNSQTITTSIQTDGGAISGSLGLAKQVVDATSQDKVHAYDYADSLFSSAINFADKNDTRSLNAYDRAAAIQTDALHTLQGAYADARGTTDSQKQIIFGVLAVAAIMAFAILNKG